MFPDGPLNSLPMNLTTGQNLQMEGGRANDEFAIQNSPRGSRERQRKPINPQMLGPVGREGQR
jgi:hypothetical protein